MKTVKINSSENVFVYGTSYTQNKSNDSNPINLNPTTWLKTQMLIQKGIHEYPEDILQWPSVRALVDNEKITVSKGTGSEPTPEEAAAVKAVEKAEEMRDEEEKTESKKKARKKRLEDIADKLEEKQLEEAVKGNGRQE